MNLTSFVLMGMNAFNLLFNLWVSLNTLLQFRKIERNEVRYFINVTIYLSIRLIVKYKYDINLRRTGMNNGLYKNVIIHLE